MDTTTLGETAAHLMDDLADAFEDDDSAEVGTVMVIAEIKGEDEECDWTSVRFRCSDPRIWVQNGMLFHALNSEVAPGHPEIEDGEDD